MANIIIIHGAFGNPDENWIPWLKKELETLGHNIITPRFPTPDNQNLESWNKIIKPHLSSLDENSILIGHSIGATFIPTILENLNLQIKASFLISGFLQFLGDETFDEINKTFIQKEFNWPKIQANSKSFFIYHGDNDPYVPIECSYRLAEKLNSKTIVIKDGGHINESAGFKNFPKLLEDIKSTF